jgi:hypothetical protein
MDGERNIETLLRWSVFPILALVSIVQTYADRGLFADGANFFLDILTRVALPWWDHQRIFNHLVTKTPAYLAILLGVRDIVVLRALYSFWILSCPLLIWAAALWGLRRDILFWPFAMFFCLVYFSTDFFAIGEYNLCFALLGYCFAGLVRPLPEGSLTRAGLLAAALFLSLDYPATLFSGSLLALLAVTKPDKEWNGASRAYRIALVILFLLSVASALWETAAPRDPGNLAGARNPAALLQDAQFWCTLFYAGLAAAVFLAPKLWLQFTLAALCIGLLIRLALDPFRFYPYLHYAIRAYMSVALALCGVGLWWFRTRGRRMIRTDCTVTTLLPALLGVVLLATLSLFDIVLSLDYARYVEAFRREVNGKTGLIPYEQSVLPALIDNDRFNWEWTNPLMSVVLRDNAQKAIILNSAGYHAYQPFDPHKEIPDLSAYYR